MTAGLGELVRKASLAVPVVRDTLGQWHLGRWHLDWMTPGALLAVAALAAFASAAWVLLRPRRASVPYRSDDPVVRALLADVAFLWTGDGTERRRVQLQKLSRLWKNPDIAADVQPDPDLRYDPLIGFYEQHVRTAPYFRGALVQRQVVIQLLETLDREGDVPSVLRVQPVGDVRDAESFLADTTFNLLTHTSLRDHALHVALEVIQRLTDQGARHIIPDAMIAALGHDIAKVPSQRRELSQIGDHSLAAGVLLTSLDGFNDLKHKDELLRAVKLHHRDPQDRLGKLLKQAEEASREYEKNEGLRLAPSFAPAVRPAVPPTGRRAVRPGGSAETRPAGTGACLPPGPGAEPAAPDTPAREGEGPGRPAPALRPPEKGMPLPDPSGGDAREAPSDSAGAPAPPVVPLPDISSWFDLPAFLGELASHLNRPEGTKFPALSMASGHVYVTAELAEKAVRGLAERAGNRSLRALAAASEELRQVLLAVLEKLWDAGCLDPGLMRRGELGARFLVSFGTASRTAFYVVFRVGAFQPWGTLEELEARKNSAVRRIRSVVPEPPQARQAP